KKLYKSKTDRKLAGVCGGIAEYIGIDSTLVRLALVIFCLAGGSGLILYLVAALVMPEEP
ncbi:MAG: PspC domain-containing protein, partial [Clostridia bacterium]|nr:PspC domain-containing protein [Clostridia bacterium]